MSEVLVDSDEIKMLLSAISDYLYRDEVHPIGPAASARSALVLLLKSMGMTRADLPPYRIGAVSEVYRARASRGEE